MRRLLALALLAVTAAATVACDPCAAAMSLHEQRCAGGDSTSCEWIQANGGNVEAPACG